MDRYRLQQEDERADMAGDGDNWTDAIAWHANDMPYSHRYDDHYYSRDDGRAECRHVFIEANALPARMATADRFTIGELGFGTGLNAIETWRVFKDVAPAGARLVFHSFELFPLTGAEMARALAVWPELEPDTVRLLSLWPEDPRALNDIQLQLDASTELVVHVGDVRARIADISGPVDCWYLDGFAPSRNPEMWEEPLFTRMRALSSPDATFATYSAAGFVRRNLMASGFAVEKIAGHAGKREMLRGRVAP